MAGRPLQRVKQAAQSLVERLQPGDRISVVAFDHTAKIIVPLQNPRDLEEIQARIARLEPKGGTAIDQGMRVGLDALSQGKSGAISQVFLLTDGENEHGDNQRCLQFAQLAASCNITLNALGFGDHWNQDVLEQIADAGGGTLTYIERPEQAVDAFNALFSRIETVGLTHAHLLLKLQPGVRLAELKPIAQVAPDTIELAVQMDGDRYSVRIGDLMTHTPRKLLANLYLDRWPEGTHAIAYLQVRYDDPALGQSGLLSETVPVEATWTRHYSPAPNPDVQQCILTLAKYRQTQIAESKLLQGDRAGAATLLQSAAQTALQMGDTGAATVLQDNATRLQSGETLSQSDRKKTRIVSKTILK